MEIQRLRNLTTGRLHTDMGHIYQDIELLTGMGGGMTHMIPNVMRAMTPWLKDQVTESRLWDGEFDTNHMGEIDIDPMSEAEQKLMLERYSELPSPFGMLT